MTKQINVKISDDLYNKITKSGLKISVYTRNALEFYDERKRTAGIMHDINIIQDCIDILESEKKIRSEKIISENYKNIYENEENVKKTDDKEIYENEENVKKIYANNENVIQNVKKTDDKEIYENEENVKKTDDKELKNQLKNHLSLLSKLLNLHGTVPDATIKKIHQETGIKTDSITEFIYNNSVELKKIPYEFSRKATEIMPGNKKYKE